MKDEAIIKVATEFAEHHTQSRYTEAGIFMAALSVCEYLKMFIEGVSLQPRYIDYSGQVVEKHVIKLPGGRFVDVTAGMHPNPQTGDFLGVVYIGELPEYYQLINPKTGQ